MTSSETGSEEKDNVVPFPVASKAFEEAAVWLARLEKGLGDGDRRKLVDWHRDHPDNGKALYELASFWGDLDLLAELALPDTFSGHNPIVQKRSVKGWRIAAAVLVAAGGLGMFAYVTQAPAGLQTTAQVQFEQTYTTSIGERITEVLPDGSSITLNTNTEVHVLYQNRDRIIDLRRGEANFEVAHDVERPFGVRANGHIVQAVGTAFNVRIQDAGEVEVTVTDGIVQILEDDRPAGNANSKNTNDWWTNSAIGTGLVPGQVAMLDSQSPDTAVTPEIRRLPAAALEMKLAWQQGVLIFEGEPLEAVLEEFSRYTTTEFTLDSQELAEKRVGGYFNTGDIDGLLETLSENFHIKAQHTADDRVLLLPEDE